MCMRNLHNLKIVHYSCTISRLECNLGILRMHNAILRLHKFSDCTQHTMYTLYVCFILKSCCLVPRLHSLSFTSLSHSSSLHMSSFLSPSSRSFSLHWLAPQSLQYWLPCCSSLHVLISSSPLLTPISHLFSFLYPHSDRDACERS